ncbi:hypothetical protein ACKKBF_B13345 [Auxenochlorella protothecoides x Auxenochlorella symbiontica]
MSTDWVHELTVAKLKDELKKRDLHVTGKKAELIERLEEFLKEAEGADAASDGKSADEGAEPQDEDMKDAAADEASQDDNADRKDGGSESRFTSSDDEAVPVESSGHGSPAKGDGSMHSEDRSGAAVAGQDGGAGAEEAVAADEESGPVANGDGAEAPAAPGAGSETPAVAGASERESKEDPVPEAASPAGKPEAPTAASLVEEVVDLDYGEEEAEAAAAAAAATSVRTKGAAAAGASPGTVPTSGKRPRGDDDAPAAAAAPLQKAPRAERPAAEGVVTASTTRALRIDGFVRPFTERAVRELLDPTGAELKALWMPSIKTHCYSVFASKAAAAAALAATAGLTWPAASPKTLAPRHVALREAERAIGQGAGNPDFRVERLPEDGEEEAEEAEAAASPAAAEAVAAAAAPAAAAAREGTRAAPVRPWDREKLEAGPRGAAAGPLEGVRDLRELLQRRSSDGGEAARRGPGAGGDAAPAAPGAHRVADARPPPAQAQDEPGEPLQLDDLFRRTAAKPSLYWLPLTAEQVAAKRAGAGNGQAAAIPGSEAALETRRPLPA